MKRLLAAAALIFAACAKPRPGDIPTVHFGVDTCARCGMAVSEERFASGWVAEAGHSVVFDDVGEFVEAVRGQPGLARLAFVHDAEDGRWLRADDAYFIQIRGLATPMGTGFAAFASEARARSFGRKLGAEGTPVKLESMVAASSGGRNG